MNNILAIVQLTFTLITGLYFFTMLKSQYTSKNSVSKDSEEEMERLRKLNKISLTEPLTEKTRPKTVKEVIGQKDGIKALRAALCGKNPQHIIIYGPPGIGKTAASRVILNEAIKNPDSPFNENSKFIEVDATTMQFDERSIADPLIGSVHDPIYQGAGAYGPAGIPQPKEGAVTKAHGGVLFLDEIGELHSIQMNKLLKVLEDRRVFFDSSYYNKKNKEIPRHIHEIFEKGLPADFRLIGATTRSPEEIPPALRSRCVEIFFRQLERDEILTITKNAFDKNEMEYDIEIPEYISGYAKNGRDAVKIVQTASSVARMEGRRKVLLSDAEWVVKTGKFVPVYEKKVMENLKAGQVLGLAVSKDGKGFVLDIEAAIRKCHNKSGTLTVTGIIEEEEIEGRGQKLKKHSSINSSVKNVVTALGEMYDFSSEDYNIHVNFAGSVPVDGPSAGVAVMTALYSALYNMQLKVPVALTGEISIYGNVLPVGEVTAKIKAGVSAGIKKFIIPKENYKIEYKTEFNNVEIVAVESFEEVIVSVFGAEKQRKIIEKHTISENINTISALGG